MCVPCYGKRPQAPGTCHIALQQFALALWVTSAQRSHELAYLRSEEPGVANAVGETATGTEDVPAPQPLDAQHGVSVHGDAVRVLVTGRPRCGNVDTDAPLAPEPASIVAPNQLPEGSVVVALGSAVPPAEQDILAHSAVCMLGAQGDSDTGSWAVESAPVLFVAEDGQGAYTFLTTTPPAHVANWGILTGTTVRPPLAAACCMIFAAHAVYSNVPERRANQPYIRKGSISAGV